MMIQVENLTKYFGPILAVDRASFEVDKGQIVGFLGLNGAGKTTTMRILTSYLPATSGIARVAGYDVMTQSMEVRRSIGYLPESVPLYGEMRVEEYLKYRAKLKEVPRDERRRRVEHCAGTLPDPRGAPAAHRHPVARLSPARRPGGRDDSRPAHPHPRRADRRPGSDPDSGDPVAYQAGGRDAHGVVLDPHPCRGGGGLPAGHHHQARPYRSHP